MGGDVGVEEGLSYGLCLELDFEEIKARNSSGDTYPLLHKLQGGGQANI